MKAYHKIKTLLVGLSLAAFADLDTYTKKNSGTFVPPQSPLVPGKTRPVRYTLKASHGGNCRADINYTMDYTLRHYQNL